MKACPKNNHAPPLQHLVQTPITHIHETENWRHTRFCVRRMSAAFCTIFVLSPEYVQPVCFRASTTPVHEVSRSFSVSTNPSFLIPDTIPLCIRTVTPTRPRLFSCCVLFFDIDETFWLIAEIRLPQSKAYHKRYKDQPPPSQTPPPPRMMR